MSNNKSMLDVALEAMKDKKAVSFSTIWSAVCKELELTDDEKKAKVGNFYTQLSLDGRFVALGGNKWSLRDRLPYDKIHVDLSEVYNDMESESDGDDEEEEEQKKEKPAESSEGNNI